MRKTLMAEVFRLTRVYNIHLLQSDSDTPDPEEAFNHLFGGESK
jgi:hypothetical protein